MTTTEITTRDRSMERIAKLLSQAAGAGTSKESETFAGKAAELMGAHSVDEAIVAAYQEGRKDPMVHREILLEDPYLTQRALLLGAIAEHMSCNVVRTRDGRAHVFGKRSDVDRLHMLFLQLLLQAIRLVQNETPATGSGPATTSFRKSWMNGFAMKIHERMAAGAAAAIRQHDEAPESVDRQGAALVLVARMDAATKAMRDHFPGMKITTSTVRSGNAEAHRAGAAAGSRADLGRRQVTPSRRAISA
jgi:hypothetical protein